MYYSSVCSMSEPALPARIDMELKQMQWGTAKSLFCVRFHLTHIYLFTAVLDT